LDARQDYDRFWDKTPAEITRILEAAIRRDERDHEEARIRNYELANLIAFAHHDPKKMPEYKPIASKPEAMSDEVQQARARGAFIALALRSKG